MRPIYSHSPAFTGNGFQLQMTHRAFVHFMLTRLLIKWVWISSKSWLWKWGSKTDIWIADFLLVVATYFLLWPALHFIWGTVELADTHTVRFQKFKLKLNTVNAHHNFSKCKIMNRVTQMVWVMWYLGVCWTAVVTLIGSISILCRRCLCGTRVDLQ